MYVCVWEYVSTQHAASITHSTQGLRRWMFDTLIWEPALLLFDRVSIYSCFVFSMGMSHDDDHATCTGHSHIMSGEWVKGRNPSDLSWSSCSRDDLENFLRWDSILMLSDEVYFPPCCEQWCGSTIKSLCTWRIVTWDFWMCLQICKCAPTWYQNM